MIELPKILVLPPNYGLMHVERKLREIIMVWENHECSNLVTKGEFVRPEVNAFVAKHLPYEITLPREDTLCVEQITRFTPWLNENCQGYWTIVWTLSWDDLGFIRFRFTDPRDAVLFRVIAA